LIVEPDLRRNGIGTQLLKAVESNMPHVTEYFLFTGSESKGNIVLYEKAGYVVNGQTVEDHGVTLVGMSKINLGYKTAG
jgi:GNAT superfamily N-acetyltransferase